MFCWMELLAALVLPDLDQLGERGKRSVKSARDWGNIRLRPDRTPLFLIGPYFQVISLVRPQTPGHVFEATSRAFCRFQESQMALFRLLRGTDDFFSRSDEFLG
jgi:hypothetical protein